MEWFFLFFGIFLLIIGIWTIHTTASCKKEIKGTYVKANIYKSIPTQGCYAPVFRYCFEDREYEQQSLQSFSEKDVEKMYSHGEEYSIYIKEKNPTRFVVRQKIQIAHILIIVCGVLMLGIAFVGFVVN